MASQYLKAACKSTVPSESVVTFYEQLFSTEFFVFEKEEPYFQEKLLQAIWNEQLVKEALLTEQGEPVRVVHPGIWNVEAGPDFHDAVIQVAGQTRRGAVELHLRPEGWHQHGHQHNPEYRQVILHVVWQNPGGHGSYPLGVPLVSLIHQLSQPLPEIMDQINLSAYPYSRQVQPGENATHLASLSDPFLRDLFQSYGVARILQKAHSLSQQIDDIGLEPAVYHKFLDIMGYKNNREAFAQLAAFLPLEQLAGCDLETTLALFFGAAGLLPDPTQAGVLPRHEARVQRLWRTWWKHRHGHLDIHWNRHRQRPYNAPERRLAGAALILHTHQYQLGQRLIDCFLTHEDPADCLRALRHTLSMHDEQPDWQRFLNFEKDLNTEAQLIGTARIQDLLVNLAVPLFLAWCLLHDRPDLCHRGKCLLAAVPKLQSNRLFKEAIHHFFVPPSRARQIIDNACAQQGLLKLYRDWSQAS